MPRRSVINDLFTSAADAARVFHPGHATRADERSLVGYQRWKRHNKSTISTRPYDAPTAHIQPTPTARVSANDPYAALSREMAYDAQARNRLPRANEAEVVIPAPATPSLAKRPAPPPPMRDVPPPPRLTQLTPPKVPVVSRLGLSVPFASEREPKKVTSASKALVPYVPPKATTAPLAQPKTQMPIPPAEALGNDTISRAIRKPAKYSLKSRQAQNMRGITRGAQIAALSLVGGPK